MMKIRLSLFLFLILLNANFTFAQKPDLHISIHDRVDTSQAEIREVAMLWINYLKSKPDSVYDNPYWNAAEKSLYKNFDFSVSFLYQFPSQQLLAYFKPTILSIEKEGEYYGIRTLFYADGLDGDYRKSNPWCITKLYAVKEKGNWKLMNALHILTEKWNRKTIGKITFVYPSSHTFNTELATKASIFCDQLSQEFKFPEWKPFEFYISPNTDEMGKLFNFDFYYAGYTTGVGMNENRKLFSALGSEYYPHEFVHLIVPPFNRHGIIEEGFATWKAGQKGMSFDESAKQFANELAKNNQVTFTDVLHKKWGWQYSAYYTTGAILCNYAYKKGGIDLVNKLLLIPNNDDHLIENLAQLFHIKPNKFDEFWRMEVLRYK